MNSILQPTTGNKELDSLNEEIRQLQIEKAKLESDVNQQDTNLKLKQSEIKNLQNEIEILHQMIKQLDTQKVEASKRLEELKVQNNDLVKTVHDVRLQLQEEQEKVENVRRQHDEQLSACKEEEGKLSVKQEAMNATRTEEQKLKIQLEHSKKESDYLTKSLGDTQLQISQVKTKLLELEDYERLMQKGLDDLEKAIANNDENKMNTIINTAFTPPNIEIGSEKPTGFEDFSFNQNDDQFTSIKNEFADSFCEDSFYDDPFKGEDPFKSEELLETGGFSSEGFSNDPFASANAGKFDILAGDAFGNTGITATATDPFGSDPFTGNLPARSESPTPELPPKKSKSAPPRPAPPKNKTPQRAAPAPPLNDDPFTSLEPWPSNTNTTSDPFASTAYSSSIQGTFDPFGTSNDSSKDPFGTTSDNFANFANFDKCEIPPPVDPYATLSSIHKLSITQTATKLPVLESHGQPWIKNERMERRKKVDDQEKTDYESSLKLKKNQTKSNSFSWV